jgi:tetratricopeptide (TPR) repeat protein
MTESHRPTNSRFEPTRRDIGIKLTMRLSLLFAVAALLLLAPRAQAAGAPNCTSEQGQALIDAGRYEPAIREFTCLVEAEPTEVEGYRGRAEAKLFLGRYSDALADYARVTAFVEPVHPDAKQTIKAGYAARLASAPNDVPALTGASFARWAFFDYAQAIHLLNRLLEVEPDDDFGTLFRGSSRVLQGGPNREHGVPDLDRAILLAPQSPDVRWVVADAYTYGMPDPERAFAEATLALEWGLDTPRVHAILGASYNVFGDRLAAAYHIARCIELAGTELVATAPLAAGDTLTANLVPGQVYEIPIPAIAGESISFATSSKDYWDTIAVLLAPDGTPVVGSDDDNGYFAASGHEAEEDGTYRLRVTFFESVNTGALVVSRD